MASPVLRRPELPSAGYTSLLAHRNIPPTTRVRSQQPPSQLPPFGFRRWKLATQVAALWASGTRSIGLARGAEEFPNTPSHQYFSRPARDMPILRDIEATPPKPAWVAEQFEQKIIGRPLEPCFWIRGILPASTYADLKQDKKSLLILRTIYFLNHRSPYRQIQQSFLLYLKISKTIRE